MPLPVNEIRAELEQALRQGPVVLTAPTGTGKSTQVPRWFSGRTLVIQPRRVACRAVASRIASLENIELGTRIGYRVRDDDCSTPETELLVVTPGIILSRPALLKQFDRVILDEFHERRLDTDLILALLQKQDIAFVLMSATFDARAIAEHVGGTFLSVSTRIFPVEEKYESHADELPSVRNLDRRIAQIIEMHAPSSGDILVFLPGKAEISQVESALKTQDRATFTLHGGLSLDQQARVLNPSSSGRIILSTNVAETSLTIPGVHMVIDSGLVRRTEYHHGRSYLTLSSVAADSAQQRAGRAGRTAPGLCVRMWGQRAQLAPISQPEILRESLIPLIMTTANLGLRPESLAFLDPPRDYALKDARSRLTALGALHTDTNGNEELTKKGRALQGLPLDPWLSRVLIEAKETGALSDAIDLIAMLEQPRAHALAQLAPDEELDFPDCDASALLWVMRSPLRPPGTLGFALREARNLAQRLRKALSSTKGDRKESGVNQLFDRARLLKTLLKADGETAYVARRRKGKVRFAGSGKELELGRDSRVQRLEERFFSGDKKSQVEGLLVLSSRAVVQGRERKLIATLASSVPLKWLADSGVGDECVKSVAFSKSSRNNRRLIVQSERIYAGRVLSTSEKEPTGDLARAAIVKLFLSGRLHKPSLQLAEQRLERRRLAARLGQISTPFFEECNEPPNLEEWLSSQLLQWGVEQGEDLALLSPEDFLPEDVPPELAPTLLDRYPLQVDLGDCLYKVTYDLSKKHALLSIVRGSRSKPPPANYLPRFEGFRVFVEAGGNFHPLRR